MKWTNHQDLEKLRALHKKKSIRGKAKKDKVRKKLEEEKRLKIERDKKLKKELASRKWDGNYKLYLKSDEWKKIRGIKLGHADYRCQLCNKKENLQVHHRTYERIFMEDMRDLTVLCEDCHRRFHSSVKYEEMTMEAINKLIDDKIEEAVLAKIVTEFYPD